MPARLLVGLIVLVGVILRFYAGTPLWLDEAISAALASEGLAELFEGLRHDGHPPFYYLLLMGWTKIFGGSDEAVRALSGVISVLSLVGAGFLLRKVAGRWMALMMVGVLASSPFAIRYATEVRMYALLVFLLLLGHGAFGFAWIEPTRRRLAGVVAVTTALIYTHYWSLFLLAVLGAGLVFLLLAKDLNNRKKARRLLLAMGLGALPFLLWLPTFFTQLAHTGTPWSPAPRPSVVAALALEAYGGGRGSEALLVAVLFMVLVSLGVWSRPFNGQVLILGLTDLLWLRVAVGVGVATMGLGMTVSLLMGSAFQGRYAVFAFVPLVAAAGVGLARLPRHYGLAVLVALALLSGVSVARELSRDRTQLGEVAQLINQEGQPGDLVVFCPDQLAPAGNRLLGESFELLAYPTLDTGKTVNWSDYAKRNAATEVGEKADEILAMAGANHGIWLVWVDGYATFGSQCGQLHRALAEGSSESGRMINADGDRFYNSANLTHFGG